MNYEIGQIVISKAGHDKSSLYIVKKVCDTSLELINGTNRTIDKPKMKKIIHIQPTKYVEKEIAKKIISGEIINEEIKRAIKLYKENK